MSIKNLIVTLCSLTLSVSAFADAGQEAFERLKTLVGTWEAQGSNGERTQITYELVSDGSAVLEKASGMVTMYHRDGANLMMTHYCSAGNQPRLRATDFSTLPQKLHFSFLDVTNAVKGSGYINDLRIEIVNQDTVVETWGYTNGNQQSSTTFKLKRTTAEAKKSIVVWFEIPTTDLARAAKFYSAVFQLDMKPEVFEGYPMAFFPFNDQGISGALIKDEHASPSAQGPLIYLNGGADLSQVLARVEAAGGKVLTAKTLITKEIGYFGVFLDSEGNRVAVHSKQ